jgi:hypothetical protein
MDCNTRNVDGMHSTEESSRVVMGKIFLCTHTLPIVAVVESGLMTHTGEVEGELTVFGKMFPRHSIPVSNGDKIILSTTIVDWRDLHHRLLRMLTVCFTMSNRRKRSPTKFNWT